MQRIKKIIVLFCALFITGLTQGSCPSNYTTVSGTGDNITFSVCYPSTMVVGNTYNIYLTITNNGGTTSGTATKICGFFPPSGFTSDGTTLVLNPANGNFGFDNTSFCNGSGVGEFLYSNGIVAGATASGYSTVTPTAVGIYTYDALGTVPSVTNVTLPITINVIGSCPTVTASSGTGCAAGDLASFVTGGNGAYSFTGGGAIGGTLILASDGVYSFSANSGSFEYSAMDVAGCMSNTGTISVSNPSLTRSGSVIYNMVASTPITVPLGVTGGTPPYTFNLASVNPTINGNATYNSGTQQITFTQTATGASRLRYYATDANGCATATQTLYFFSCPAGSTASATLGSSADTALIYAICYPSSASLGSFLNITASVININPEGAVASASLVDLVPDPSQVTYAPGLLFISNGPVPPGSTFDPTTTSDFDMGGMGTFTPPFPLNASSSVSLVIELEATADGQQTYYPYAIGNPATPLAPPVSILVSACTVSATDESLDLCLNSATTGNLESLISGGVAPFTFGPSGATAAGGVVTINPSGPFIFTATTGFSGPGGFTYNVVDSIGCVSTGTVGIFVDSLAAGNTGLSTCTGSLTGSLLGLVTGGTGPLIFTGPLGLSCVGSTVAISSSGLYTYVAPNGFTGPCSFVYGVTDALPCTATGVVTITANSVPTANNVTLSTCQNTAVSNSLANFISGSTTPPLTFTIVTPPTHGTLTAFNATTGAFTYTPTTGFIGVDSFRYQVTNSSGCVSNVGTVTINIPCCPPTAAFPALIEQLYFNLPPGI